MNRRNLTGTSVGALIGVLALAVLGPAGLGQRPGAITAPETPLDPWKGLRGSAHPDAQALEAMGFRVHQMFDVDALAYKVAIERPEIDAFIAFQAPGHSRAAEDAALGAARRAVEQHDWHDWSYYRGVKVVTYAPVAVPAAREE